MSEKDLYQKLITWTTPGIRAQLLNKKTKELFWDYVIEADKDNIHILNAVSLAFTSTFPFGSMCWKSK